MTTFAAWHKDDSDEPRFLVDVYGYRGGDFPSEETIKKRGWQEYQFIEYSSWKKGRKCFKYEYVNPWVLPKDWVYR